MRHSTLSEHKFKKGVFITPFNSMDNIYELPDDYSWTYGRMPEYLWIALILKRQGREKGLEILQYIISEVHLLAPEVETLRLSDILRLDESIQARLYDYIVKAVSAETLAPLTIVLTHSNAPTFSRYFCCPELTIKERRNILVDAMNTVIDQHSNEATDVRYIVIYFHLMIGKLKVQPQQLDIYKTYYLSKHDDEVMRVARPSVRSTEMLLLNDKKPDTPFLENFWRVVSEMSDCELYATRFPEEKNNIGSYISSVYEVLNYLKDVFVTTELLNAKIKILLGIGTYSYKRFHELYSHNMFNSIAGRSCVRVMVEDYIMMKYLLIKESERPDIWSEYERYGLGQYKLVLSRSREKGIDNNAHFDDSYVELLVNEFLEEEYINMDTKYFEKDNIRIKAKLVGEDELYGLYYDYDSAFEHGLWGAIRESSMIKCTNPAHLFHCVPDINDDIVMKSVLPDCIKVMNKTIKLLDKEIGIPEEIYNEVMRYELKPSGETN